MNKINKIFAISDVHGCYDELMALYKQLPITPKTDQLIILGDHIDRGPKSKQVVEQLIEWKKKYPHWQFIYGNHEDLMLDALMYNGRVYNSFDLWYQQGGKETFLSYVDPKLSRYEKALIQIKDAIPQVHLEFLAGLPMLVETDDYFFVHGGLKPGVKIEDQDLQDLIWIRESFIDSTYDFGKKVIFGHTADGRGSYYNQNNPWGRQQRFMPIVKKNKIGIDTAVCARFGGRLTALELPAEKFYFQETFRLVKTPLDNS